MCMARNEFACDCNVIHQDLVESTQKQMVDEDSELITILYGKDVEENDIKPFIEKLEDEYEDLDIQCYSGNQPLYYFFVSVE